MDGEGQGGEREEQRTRLGRGSSGSLDRRHRHLANVCLFSIVVQANVNPPCVLPSEGLPLALMRAILPAVVPATIVCLYARGNASVRGIGTVVLETCVATVSMVFLGLHLDADQCRHRRPVGILGVVNGCLSSSTLLFLGSLDRSSARRDARAGGGLAAWFAGCALAAVGVVTHGGRWEEVVAVASLMLCCALVVAGGIALFRYYIGRDALATVSSEMGAWSALCIVAATVRDGISEKSVRAQEQRRLARNFSHVLHDVGHVCRRRGT